jgi:hypothetical protein
MRAHIGFCWGTVNHLDLTHLCLIACLSIIANSGQRVSFVLKQLGRIKEKGLRGSKSSGTRRGLMILKIFLEMEWMLILGGDLGLYVYFVVVAGPRLLRLKNFKANGDYAFLRFLSSVLFFPRRAVRILSFRAAIRSMTWPAAGRFGATVICRPFAFSSNRASTRSRYSSS